MKTSTWNILLVLLAIGILIGAYYLLYQPEKDKETRLNVEIGELQARYDELKAMEAHRDEYIAETENLKKQFDEELAKYAPDMDQENTIMYLKGTEVIFEDFMNISVGLPQPTAFYVLGSGAAQQDAGQIVDNTPAMDETFTCYNADYPINFTGRYEEIKDYLDYVADYKYRMNVKSITLSYDPETEMANGSIVLGDYAIVSDSRTPDVPDVDQPLGVDNIFVGGEGAPTGDSSPYAEDSGEAIVGTHTLVLLLNSAKNDAASGVIVAASESDDKTYVTYEENDVADVKITVYSDADKNFVKYEIGSNSYETELLTSDVTIYVKSSDRVDSEDKNGAKVSIENETGIPVYIKVANDTTAGRFKLGTKSGSVKVYQ